MTVKRAAIAGVVLSAAGLITIATSEGFRGTAYLDTVGVPTIGFGTTDGVKLGDKITVPAALDRMARDVTKFEGAVKRCVTVPLYQYEYDAYVDFAYNIGPTKFCNSTLVIKLNGEDYAGACAEISRWVKQPELAKRRAEQRAKCEGK